MKEGEVRGEKGGRYACCVGGVVVVCRVEVALGVAQWWRSNV